MWYSVRSLASHAGVQVLFTSGLFERRRSEMGVEKTRAIASAQPPAKSKGWQTMKDTLQWMSSDKTSRVSFIFSKPTCQKCQTTIFKSGSRTGGSESKPSKTDCSKTFQTIEGWVIFLSKIREKNHMLTKAAYAMSHCFTKAKDGRREKKKT